MKWNNLEDNPRDNGQLNKTVQEGHHMTEDSARQADLKLASIYQFWRALWDIIMVK